MPSTLKDVSQLISEPETAAGRSLADNSVFDCFLARKAHLPEWWLQLKRQEWDRFISLPPPSRNDEDWRFANIDAITLDQFQPADAAPEGEIAHRISEASREFDETAGQMIFANDRLIDHQEIPLELSDKGVVWMPIERAIVEREELFRKHFMAQPIKLGSEKFAALHAALCSAGSFLYIPAGVKIDSPIVAYHWATEENRAIFPHTIVIAGAGSKVTFLDFFNGADRRSRNFIVGASGLYAEPGAELRYASVQKWGERSLAFHLNHTQALNDSNVTYLNLHLGSRFARAESHSQALGEKCCIEMLSLAMAAGEQELDQRTLQTHVAPRAKSDLVYKNVLLDKSRVLFSGLIRVEPTAQQTDAYQSNRNLLLNPEAEANSLPGLEIQTNDVKCSHGATTGQIEPEQMYYMQSRGIPPQVAKELLTFGFFEEVLGKFGDEAISAKLREKIREKFTK